MPNAPFLAVLWRRRWTLALVVFAMLALASAYLYVAPPVYRSSAKLLVDQNPASIHIEGDRGAVYSENYVQTQVDGLRSAPVLSRALEKLDTKGMQTFAGARRDPLNWMLKGSALGVEAIKRSDTVIVSMESPDAKEAQQIVTAVVEAHLIEQAQHRRENGQAMVQALREEKKVVDARRDEVREQMNAHQQRHGVVSFQDNKANDVLERTAALATSVTNAQLATVELKARKQAVEEAFADPVSRRAFVSTELMKGRDGGDREYDELRTLLVQSEIALSISKVTQASDNRGIQAQEARLATLREQLAEKEMRLAEAHRVELATKIAAAEAQLLELQAALAAQQKQAVELSAVSSEHGKYAAELEALQKQSSGLADRIVQISVNSLNDGPLPVRLVEPARVEPKAVKPQKAIVLLTAMLVGWVVGLGVVMLRETRDDRVRDPEEAAALAGAATLAMVPRTARRLSASQRGQLVHLDGRSAPAEAYRAIRTALRLGAGGNCKTVLVTSASAGEGKSTTASNLAIACAQAGERTLLVDCDLRQPVQHRIFGVDASQGLAAVLAGQAKLGDVICATATPDLYVLPCGDVPTDPSEQLTGKRFEHAMQRLSATFDRVILDSPPVMTITDAHILAASADATLLVLRLNQTTRSLTRRCRDALDRVGASVLGVVVNDVPARLASRYYGGSWPYGAPPRTKALAAPSAPPSSHEGRHRRIVVEGEEMEQMVVRGSELSEEIR